MKEISVVIPSYNAGEYIGDCIDSLLNQTFKDIEIIIVNDGSKDNTLEVLSRYTEKYPEIITVINQENQGQSVARNTGIAVAKGNYIAFIDADDYIKENMLEVLYNKAKGNDSEVVACNVSCVYPDKTIIINSGISVSSAKLTKEEKRQLLFMYPIVCNKLFKRDLFAKKGLSFEPGIWFEDVLFINTLVAKIDSISYVDDCLYEYIQRPKSVTYTYSDKLYDIHTMLDKTIEFYKETGIYDDFKEELEYMYVRYMFATFIKRLSKAKDIKVFNKGMFCAINKVKKNFPDYKSNKYILSSGAKGLYLKYFNRLFAYMIFIIERNRMN